LISKMAGNEQGFAMGMNNAYMSIGNVIGPTLAGILYDVKISYPFILGLALLMVTLVITVSWQKKVLQAKPLGKNY
ncbi:MFS transporter, partial [Escherichia coli]|nr:MFS transporter [Escherichia coli]